MMLNDSWIRVSIFFLSWSRSRFSEKFQVKKFPGGHASKFPRGNGRFEQARGNLRRLGIIVLCRSPFDVVKPIKYRACFLLSRTDEIKFFCRAMFATCARIADCSAATLYLLINVRSGYVPVWSWSAVVQLLWGKIRAHSCGYGYTRAGTYIRTFHPAVV